MAPPTPPDPPPTYQPPWIELTTCPRCGADYWDGQLGDNGDGHPTPIRVWHILAPIDYPLAWLTIGPRCDHCHGPL